MLSFFTNISQVRYQLSTIGTLVDDDDLVQTVFYGLPSSWETFFAAISGREVQPNFERLWHDCQEEEDKIQRRASGVKEGNLALAAKTKKFKKSFPPKKKEKEPQSKHLDVSKD